MLKVLFADILVTCGDSNKAVLAFKCFRHYNMPLGNYDICDELCNDSANASDTFATSERLPSTDTSRTELADVPWVQDKNFQTFKNWWRSSHHDFIDS